MLARLPFTEVEIDDIGTYRLPNMWQSERINRLRGEARHTAVLAVGCGMTVRQFNKLPWAKQAEVHWAYLALMSPNNVPPSNSRTDRTWGPCRIGADLDQQGDIVEVEHGVEFSPHQGKPRLVLMIMKRHALVFADRRDASALAAPSHRLPPFRRVKARSEIRSFSEPSPASFLRPPCAKSTLAAASRAEAGAEVSAAICFRTVNGSTASMSTPRRAFAVAVARVGRPLLAMKFHPF